MSSLQCHPARLTNVQPCHIPHSFSIKGSYHLPLHNLPYQFLSPAVITLPIILPHHSSRHSLHTLHPRLPAHHPTYPSAYPPPPLSLPSISRHIFPSLSPGPSIKGPLHLPSSYSPILTPPPSPLPFTSSPLFPSLFFLSLFFSSFLHFCFLSYISCFHNFFFIPGFSFSFRSCILCM